MSGLGKITSLNDIENLIKTDPVEVTAHEALPSDRGEKISAARKKLYSSSKGEAVKKKQSESMKAYYETDAGKLHKEKLSQKRDPREFAKAVGKAVRVKIAHAHLKEGVSVSKLARHYNVSRASIYRYIKEFSPGRR